MAKSLIALLVVCLAPPLAIAANKCIVDGKTLYTDGDCPAGAKQAPAPGAEGKAPSLPVLPPGRWKINNSTDGKVTESEICGKPLEPLEKALETSCFRGPLPSHSGLTRGPGMGAARKSRRDR